MGSELNRCLRLQFLAKSYHDASLSDGAHSVVRKQLEEIAANF
jgi:hypothetical protein